MELVRALVSIVAVLLASLTLGACAHAPAPSCEQIGEFPGPEDFDVAELDGLPVLIVSSAARRDSDDRAAAGLHLVDPAAGTSLPMTLHGRDGCSHNFHGLATAEVEDGRWELWVINHHDPGDREREDCLVATDDDGRVLLHTVEHYRVGIDGLEFLERLANPLLTNPNDIDAARDGRLWLTNNPDWQGDEVVGDVLFKRGTGRVIRYDPGEGGGWSVFAEDFVYANGLLFSPGGDRNRLWVASAHGVLVEIGLDEEGWLVDRRVHELKPKAALDNIMAAEGKLWITGHPKPAAFIRHVRRPKAKSPTLVFAVERDPTAEGGWRSSPVLHARKGEIDAGSTAMPLDGAGTFAVGDVFEPGLRRCTIPE